VLLVALGITASAAVSFFVWACRGYVSLGLFSWAVSLAVAAFVLLPTWMLFFRTGAVLEKLNDWFALLSAGTPLLAAVFAIINEFDCAKGVLIASGLFGTLLAIMRVMHRLARRWRRPRI
jgi:hypothetical protein